MVSCSNAQAFELQFMSKVDSAFKMEKGKGKVQNQSRQSLKARLH